MSVYSSSDSFLFHFVSFFFKNLCLHCQHVCVVLSTEDRLELMLAAGDRVIAERVECERV